MAASDAFANLGVGIDGSTTTAETLSLAREADAFGFHSFWFSEGYHSRSAIVRATVVASSTSRIRIGLGILSVHTKHPALLAMDAASLDELAPGRVILGIGTVVNALRKHAIDRAGAPQVLKEAVEITKKFLSGQIVQYEGKRFNIPSPGSRIEIDTSKGLPVYIGATGPATLKLAGRYADGVLFNYPCTPSFVRYAMPLLQDGLKLSGRNLDQFDVAAYLLVSIDKNERRAIEAAKRFIAQKLPTRHSDMLHHAGVTAEEIGLIKSNAEKIGVEKAALELDNKLVQKVAIAGTPDYVIAGLKQFAGSGLKLPIIWEIIGPDRRQSLELIAKEVMPNVSQKTVSNALAAS
jgi:5,10-methylenetetrahydromethanopterin reductase